MVSEQKIVLCFSYGMSVRAIDPRNAANLDPRVMIGRIYVGFH